ncbi:MAG: hypothetical protein H6684_08190 [Deltaproteobacteria bacterium]|nr:hypothetical protein [Deltaproteobacteria bacterium]MCB9488695.1 hypothetical protein [Deltaproteobacteria bacterium]
MRWFLLLVLSVLLLFSLQFACGGGDDDDDSSDDDTVDDDTADDDTSDDDTGDDDDDDTEIPPCINSIEDNESACLIKVTDVEDRWDRLTASDTYDGAIAVLWDRDYPEECCEKSAGKDAEDNRGLFARFYDSELEPASDAILVRGDNVSGDILIFGKGALVAVAETVDGKAGVRVYAVDSEGGVDKRWEIAPTMADYKFSGPQLQHDGTGYVLLWTAYNSKNTDEFEYRVQRFDSDGKENEDVTILDLEGGYLAWQMNEKGLVAIAAKRDDFDEKPDARNIGVFLSIFDASTKDLEKTVGPVQVNELVPGAQWPATVRWLGKDRIRVYWASGDPYHDMDLYLREFQADGDPSTDEQLILDEDTIRFTPKIALQDDGEATYYWVDARFDDNCPIVEVRHADTFGKVDSDGNLFTLSENRLYYWDVLPMPDDEVVHVMSGYDDANYDYDLYIQRTDEYGKYLCEE